MDLDDLSLLPSVDEHGLISANDRIILSFWLKSQTHSGRNDELHGHPVLYKKNLPKFGYFFEIGFSD